LIMQTGNPKTGWGLWIQWVLASILGYGTGATFGNALANSIPSMACTQSSSDSLIDRLTNFPCIRPMLDMAILVVILGLGGGFMQWLVLRRRIASAGWWILASTFGFAVAPIAAIAGVMAISQIMSLDRNPMIAPILLGVLFGVLSAIMPWLVLQRQVAGAGWWVPAHLLGSLVGGVLGIVAFHAVSLIGLYQFDWAAAGVMFGAGLGAITGITLDRMLRKAIS
jgi:hypothetical protein